MASSVPEPSADLKRLSAVEPALLTVVPLLPLLKASMFLACAAWGKDRDKVVKDVLSTASVPAILTARLKPFVKFSLVRISITTPSKIGHADPVAPDTTVAVPARLQPGE